MRRRGYEFAAFTLLELLVAIGVVAVALGLLIPAVQRARAAAARSRCAGNMRQIGLSLHNYRGVASMLPTGMSQSRDRYPYLSWAGRLLPFLEQSTLWRQAQEDFARSPDFWSAPRHRAETIVISTFVCPSVVTDKALVSPSEGEIAFRHYLGVSGINLFTNDGVLHLESKVRFADIADGLSNTVAVGERPPSPDLRFGWWYAGIGQDFTGSADAYLGVREFRTTFRAPTCPHGPYRFRAGSESDMCSTFHFWSHHSGGANFLFADGSVRLLSYSADSILPALATRSGGEVMGSVD